MSRPDPTQAAPLLAAEQVQARLAASLPAWRLASGELQRSINTSGWKATMKAVTTIGHLAEVADHHPELQVSYARIDIRLSTHDAGGITEKDLALAARIEQELMRRPDREPDAALGGTPDEPALLYIDYD